MDDDLLSIKKNCILTENSVIYADKHETKIQYSKYFE